MLPCDIVFSDLDGTLLDADHRLTARTIAAVAALRRAGVPFVPVSARGPSGVMPICRALDLGPGPMVACGGALVYGAAGECLASTGMTVEAAAQAQALCAAHGAAACLYAGADWLAPNPEDPRVRREEEIVCARARRGGAQDLRPDARVHKVLAICTTSAQADALQADARAALAACNVARSSPILVEIMARGVDKGAAVRRVCNHLGLAPARGSPGARRATPPMASPARSRRSSGKENRRAGVSPARPKGAAVKRRCGTPTGPGRPGRPAPPCRARTT